MHKRAVYTLAIVVVIVAAIAATFLVSYKPLKVDDILAAYGKHPTCTPVKVVYPLDGTLFPPEIVPPTFRWEDANARASAWLVQVEFGDGQPPVSGLTRQRQWTPAPQDWETIKKRSAEKEARVLALGEKPS